jgi:alkanesulfonate monooxygenase SsuD/methylene tetrahydromethanopterin reductase-like flavin-dependent oxidoreductase (luciferase family)
MMLALLSGGRFELRIGAGNYFEEMHTWRIPLPKANEQIEGLWWLSRE